MKSKYHIYLRKDGRYEGRLPVGKNENDCVRYRSFYDIDAEKLKKRLAEEEQKLIVDFNRENATFEDLFSHWLHEKSENVRESSLSIYRCYLQSHLKPLLGNERTAEMTAEKLKIMCESGLRYRKDGKGEISVKTRIDLLRVLNNILCFGANHGYMDHLIRLEYPKAERKATGILREQEQVCLEQCLKTFFPNKEALGIYLCLYTGLRVGELCGLRWEDIDLENAILYVRRTVQRIVSNDSDKKTKIAIGPPKSFSSLREIPIPYHVLSLLRQSDQGAGNTYFLSNTTHCFEPRRMQRAFYRFLEKAGLSRRGFHCTRHTFATRWIEIGADIKTLSEILGHNSIQITLDKYVHISEKTKRENMNKIRPLCAEKPLYSDHQKVLLIPSGAGVL